MYANITYMSHVQYLAGFFVCLCDLRSVTEVEFVCKSVTVIAAACDSISALVSLSFGSGVFCKLKSSSCRYVSRSVLSGELRIVLHNHNCITLHYVPSLIPTVHGHAYHIHSYVCNIFTPQNKEIHEDTYYISDVYRDTTSYMFVSMQILAYFSRFEIS